MKHQLALEYRDYLVEVPVACDDGIAALDMSLLTQHYWSGGACEPILPAGMLPRYRVIEIDCPSWADPFKYFEYPVGYGEIVDAIGEHPAHEKLSRLGRYELLAVMALLKVKNFRSPFMQSLRSQVDAWLAGDGKYENPLSPRQLDCVISSYHIRTH